MASPTCQDPGIWGSLPALIPTAPPRSLGMDDVNWEKLEAPSCTGRGNNPAPKSTGVLWLPDPKEKLPGSQFQS